MIVLRVIRELSDVGATLGSLYCNDIWQCWTLEDAIREVKDRPVEDWKVKGKTAISAGRYRLRMTLSQRFGVVLPEVVDVPGFAGIRIHAGNTSADTEGCLLVGQARGDHRVLRSRVALAELILRLTDPEMFIDYENPPGRHLSTVV